MDNLLYTIYNGDYDISMKYEKKQQELSQQLYDEWDKVQRMFGERFVDRIFDLEGELEDLMGFHCYQEGFRLGVRLMLEAFTSANG